MIKDSGCRTEFGSGAVRDIQVGKGRCDLLPLDVVGYILGLPALRFIENFKQTGDVVYLYDALKHSCIYDDLYTMFLDVSRHFEEGAGKYGENNWQKGIPVECYVNSAVRHYLKYFKGETDENHNYAFVWNVICCIWTCEHKPELNGYIKQNA